MNNDMIQEYKKIVEADEVAWNIYWPMVERGDSEEKALKKTIEYHLAAMGLDPQDPQQYWER